MKKILGVLISISLLFSMSLPVMAAYPDVDANSNIAEATNVLKSLGIMQGDEQGNFNPDKPVTRGEMATILCNLAGAGAQSAINSGFADVTADHWASGYIAYAKNAGWINGYDEDTFGPNDVVKYEQAVKLIMAVANWGIYAEENGGYPNGWLMAAAEAGITKAGAAGAIGEDCTRAKIAMLLYYGLDANIMKQTAFGDKKWEIIENETVASKNLNIYKVEGKVENSFKHDDALDEGYIKYKITKALDVKATDIVDKIGATDEDDDLKAPFVLAEVEAVVEAADLLGYTSVAYIKVDENDEVSIPAIIAKGTRNKSVTISDMELVWNSKDFDAAKLNRNPDFSSINKRFCYWNDRDNDNFITTVKVDNDYTIIVNNTVVDIPEDATTEEVLAILVPAYGKIEMVDTDSDSDIDLFNVYSYDVAVVDTVNTFKNRILLKDKTSISMPGTLKFDTEEVEDLKDVTITLDGKVISVNDIKENDILTISCNDYTNPRYYDIKVSRHSVSGKVSGIAADNKSVFIGNKEYEVVNGLLEINSDINMLDEGIFYLDATGKIAALDKRVVASSNYGIVDKIGKDSMGMVSMRLLTLDGSKLTANVADKIKLNGEKVVLEDVILTKDNKFGANLGANATWYDLIVAIIDGNAIPNGADARLNKLITYDITNGEIDEINFAIASNEVNTFGYIGKTENTEWVAKNNRFQGGKTLSDSTVVFNLDGTIDDWKITDMDALINEHEYTPYYFAMQNDGTVGAVVIFSSTSNINQDASLAYFVDARQGVYEKGNVEEEVYYVNYYINGKLAIEALPVYDDVYKNIDVKTGTAFLFAKDDKGIVDQIAVVFEADTATFGDLGVDALDDFMMYDAADKLDNEVYYGVLVKAVSGKLTVAAAPAEDATSIAFDTFENIIVPETAKVLQYKSYASTDAKKLVACDTIVDLEASSYVRDSETQDINLAESDLTYVFFRMNNGVVTEVVGIDYIK